MDLSKLPDAQRQELEQLQKQFQEHQAQQQSAAAAAAAAAVATAAVQQQPPAYDQSQVQQSYDPSQAYDQSYYYNYNYQDPSQLQQHQQYDASYYHNYHPNAYQQPPHDPYTHPPAEQQRNAESGSGSLGLGQRQAQVQDTYVHPANPGYPVPPGLNAAAAAAVAALSQLTQFAGSMAERATGGGYVGGQGHYDQGQGQGQGHFRPPPPVGHHPPPPPSFRGGGRRGGGPFRGGGRGNFGFRPPSSGGHGPPFHGRGRGGRGRGRGGRPDHPASSHPVEGAKPSEGGGGGGAEPSVKIAWCELCRVDCTSKEILETHKNGKRHQKNLQRQQEMKGEYKPIAEPEKVEKPGSEMNITVPENETKADDDREKKPWMKRKLKGGGGRGGKRQRLGATGPPKPKVVIPLMCDLCNVKCDTQEVFDRHVGGKKHIAKLKRFQGHQAMYGPTAVQALYPPNPLLQSQAQSLSLGPTLTQPPNIAAPPPAPTYVPPQNPNPQLADAPLQFGTQNAAAAAASEPPQPA